MTRDDPWIIRTYAGHSTAADTNALFKTNLAKGQTGLSVAFDLPTQTGYDSDHVLAEGEVGKVGVPISHLGDMRTLFDGIPLADANTSMTINATAPWLLALYVAAAEAQGADKTALRGTVQNDLIKEYLSRGTYAFPPEPSLKLATDIVAWCGAEVPKWNPTNVCSYHLQEAGATEAQELAYALATAHAMLDRLRDRADVPDSLFPKLVGRTSFFVNAGIRFITEMCKMRAFVDLWEETCKERYGVDDPKLARFRYGVQVNSLGLSESQPENNVYRILLEMLAVTISKRARARAVQLPAWNEAIGLPRPWDQQWSLRAQQVLAFETDLLEFDDIFDGSPVIEAKTEALKAAAREELAAVEAQGGAVSAVESGYIKRRLVESHAGRVAAIESGEQVVVGVNRFRETEPSPLTEGADDLAQFVPAHVEQEQIERLKAWRAERDPSAVDAALAALDAAAREDRNVMPASLEAARAGVTTGEWAETMRKVYGDYRAPTGLSLAAAPPRADDGDFEAARAAAKRAADALGRPIKLLVGKPGLDGHSNGAEQIALRARDVGMEVVYEGIRLTPAQIVDAALEEGVHVVGLSILSGSHAALVRQVLEGLRAEGLGDLPVVVGGVIPNDDADALRAAGVAAVYTPKDYKLNGIMADIAHIAAEGARRMRGAA